MGIVVVAEVFAACPSPVFVLFGIVAHAVGYIENVCPDHLCHAVGTVGGDVRYGDTLAGGYFEVDDVISCCQNSYIREVGEVVEHFGVEDDFVCQDDFCAFASLYYLLGLCAVVDYEVGYLVEGMPRQVAGVYGICV